MKEAEVAGFHRVVTLQGLRNVCPSDACPTSSAGSGACVPWVRVSRGNTLDLKSSACDSLVGARFSFLWVLFRVTCTVVFACRKNKDVGGLVSRGKRIQLLAKCSRVVGSVGDL